MREEELVKQLIKIIGQIEINKLNIQHKFEEELKRYDKFQRGVLRQTNPSAPYESVDPRIYMKYVLEEGANDEKRELMGCLRSRISITRGTVSIDGSKIEKTL